MDHHELGYRALASRSFFLDAINSIEIGSYEEDTFNDRLQLSHLNRLGVRHTLYLD